uniref:Uncharacterized protein n=1 Tax=Lactuca sativa TaxID=4236 RepID=A0A9R1X3X9_LACSA|nr:hypothetical protein LSAT_V11C700346410 [Lactuca sativa]
MLHVNRYQSATKILARQLVRLRQQIANLQSSRAHMRGISTHTQALAAHSSVAVGMKVATKAMAAMNKVGNGSCKANESDATVPEAICAQMDMTVR